jgi:hypothetical protein
MANTLGNFSVRLPGRFDHGLLSEWQGNTSVGDHIFDLIGLVDLLPVFRPLIT